MVEAKVGCVKIVSVSPYMPFVGVPHAGGEFFLRHAELVSQSHDFVVVSPRTSDNEKGLQRLVTGSFRRLLVTPRRSPLNFPGRERASSLLYRALPFLTVGPFYRALMRDEQVLTELRTADRIELQWFDSVVLAPALRRLLPATPLVGVFHDVVSQGHLRMLRARDLSWRWRLLAALRLVLTIPLERRAMRCLDTAVVLSDKDRNLLARRRGTARIVVVAPPLDEVTMPAGPRTEVPKDPEVLFVGALARIENEDAALWFLSDVWPHIRSAVPSARLTIAGAEPSRALSREAARQQGVVVTGYVDSLRRFYERATVAVVPMRLGAGVKLKGVVPMLWSIPVVTTSVGAEGVSGTDVFFAVEDDIAGFAKAVIEVLRAPMSAVDVCARAFAWAHETYSAARYVRSLEELYP